MKTISQKIKVRMPNETDYRDAILYSGEPLADRPKNLVKVGIFGHNLGNAYNTGYGTLLQNKNGAYIYEIYRDGCFWPYYGSLVLK